MGGLSWFSSPGDAGGGGGSPAGGTIFGMNVIAGGGTATRGTPELRLADYGRIPMCRNPYLTALPATFPSASWSTLAPEQRIQPSFKRPPAQILDGSYDSTVRSFVSSVPGGWYCALTWWHEADAALGAGTFTGQQFCDCWYYFADLIDTTPKQAGAQVIPTVNFIGPNGVTWSDAWVPDPTLMPANSVLSFDKYGNPPPPINQALDTSAAYGGLYPVPSAKYAQIVQLIANTGWANKWAWTEFNAPIRDNDPTEAYRVQWLEDAVQHLLTRTTIGPPKWILQWEGVGNFDQNFRTAATRDWYRTYVQASP
jgi:hypothetical protein